MCSHRGRLAVEGVPPGSLSAYPVLHKGGVSCYDIDFLQTRDGQLLASHPQEVQAEVQAGGKAAGKGPPELGQWSLAELRAAGVDDDRFPTADALIKASVVWCCGGVAVWWWVLYQAVTGQLVAVHVSCLPCGPPFSCSKPGRTEPAQGSAAAHSSLPRTSCAHKN